MTDKLPPDDLILTPMASLLVSGGPVEQEKASHELRHVVAEFEGLTASTQCGVTDNRSAGLDMELQPQTLECEINAMAVQSWFVHVHLYGRKVPMLVDTGSEVTVIQSELYRKLDDRRKPPLLDAGAEIRGVGGNSIAVRGAANIEYLLGSNICETHTLIADIHHQGILGMNFFEEHDCVLDMKDGLIMMDGAGYPLHRNKSSTTKMMAVCAVMVPPMSEVVISVRPTGNTILRGVSLVEPMEDASEWQGVLIGRSLVDSGTKTYGDVPLLLANVTDYEVEIKEETILAQSEPVEEVIPLEEEQKIGDDGPVRCNQTVSVTPKTSGESYPVCIATPEATGKNTYLPEHLQPLLDRVDLKGPEKQQVRDLLIEFQSVFAEPEGALGRTTRAKHEINTGDHPPIKQRARRVPQKQQEIIDKEIDSMLQAGVIAPSESPWGSPVVLVKKKDGTMRFCVDYRKLNDVTIKDAYPLPNIEETFDTLTESKMFCSLDLASGFWQLEMAEASKEKTAFSSRKGLFEFQVMPFGLCNAPATFERLMEIVLRGMLWSRCMVYLDDIICYGKTFSDTLENLRLVLQRLQGAHLKLKPKKCELFKDQILFLGFIIDGSGIRCDPDKIEAVRKWAPPTDLGEVRSFLGFASYHRRFIKGFSEMAAPLIQLTKKGIPFIWESEQEDSFHKLQSALITAPVLVHPTRHDPFILDTDASAYAMGGEISQIQDGVERVVAYASQTFSREERNYCTTKRELLAVIRMMEKFRHYLWGRHFTVRTDHGSLRWLSNFKDSDGMLARWLVRLTQYDFEIVHRIGTKHTNADGLSRCKQCQFDECPGAPQPRRNVLWEYGAGGVPFDAENGNLTDPIMVDEALDDPGTAHGLFNLLHSTRPPPSACELEATPMVADIDTKLKGFEQAFMQDGAEIARIQQGDPGIAPVLLAKKSKLPLDKETIAAMSAESKEYVARWNQLETVHGILYYQEGAVMGGSKRRLVLPFSLRMEVLHALHDLRMSGHLGIARTTARVRERYYWPGLSADVARWCAKCAVCAGRKGKPPPKRVPMQHRPVGAPFQRVAIDILDTRKVSRKGNQYILVIYDYFTKWMDAFPLKRHTADRVAEVMMTRFFVYHGVPETIHSDQGREFESELFSQLLKMCGIEKTRTSPYRPQSNGAVERVNRTLLNMLSAYVNERNDDWDEHLCFITMAYRSSVHSVTGCTPFSMLYGREMVLPIDLMYPSPQDFRCPQCGPEYVEWVRRALMSAHLFAREHSNAAILRQKKGYDSRSKEREYLKIGSYVRYYYPPEMQKSKFARPWLGPYEVIEKVTDVNYKIKSVAEPSKSRVVHFDTLKPYESDPGLQPDVPEMMELNDGGEYANFESLWDHIVTEGKESRATPWTPPEGKMALKEQQTEVRRENIIPEGTGRARKQPERLAYPKK